jgi:adenylate cyclase
MLERFFERLTSTTILKHIEADPDMDSLRNHPRFVGMLATAKERLGVTS